MNAYVFSTSVNQPIELTHMHNIGLHTVWTKKKKKETAVMSGFQISKLTLTQTPNICTSMAKSLASVDGEFSTKRRLRVRGLEESHESHLRSLVDYRSRQIPSTLARQYIKWRSCLLLSIFLDTVPPPTIFLQPTCPLKFISQINSVLLQYG